MGRLRHLVAGTLDVVVALAAGATPAAAAPPPDGVSPVDCLRAFDREDDYVGDGWVGAPVATSGGVTLTCGDERLGVVHIAHPDSRGHGHPISPATEAAFTWCFRFTMMFGTRSDDPDFPDSRWVYKYTWPTEIEIIGQRFPYSETATAYVDKAGGFVYTLFTSRSRAYPESNNWASCATSGHSRQA